MTVPSATKQTALRADRLLRSLVGVADVRLVWDAAGVLRLVHVLKADGVRDDQLVRNVVSGLKAGLGVKLPPSGVRVHVSGDAFPEEPQVAAVEAHAAAPANGNGAAHGNGSSAPSNGHANGNGSHGASKSNGKAVASAAEPKPVAVVPPDAGFPLRPRPDTARSIVRAEARPSTAPVEGVAGPRPQLERIELERTGVVLRCRVTLSAAGGRYSAIAEAPERTGADAELAAGVTLDALRAGGFSSARLDGLGRVTVGTLKYVVAAVREPAAETTTAGAAPVGNCPVRAAAEAVLNTLAVTAERNTAGR